MQTIVSNALKLLGYSLLAEHAMYEMQDTYYRFAVYAAKLQRRMDILESLKWM